MRRRDSSVAKDNRRDAIVRLITEKEIETQEDLSKYLNEENFFATQATLSRDLKELGVFKRTNQNGKNVYTYKAYGNEPVPAKYSKILREVVNMAVPAGNIVVVKTVSGMANAAAAAIDALSWDGFIGSIAGDDTIFIVFSSNDDAAKFCGNVLSIEN